MNENWGVMKLCVIIHEDFFKGAKLITKRKCVYIICRKLNYEKADWSSVLDLTERVFTHFAGRGIA